MECFHDFQILYSGADVHIEQCKNCKESFEYNLAWNGDMDDKQYVDDHVHDFMGPWTEEYKWKQEQINCMPILHVLG